MQEYEEAEAFLIGAEEAVFAAVEGMIFGDACLHGANACPYSSLPVVLLLLAV